MSRWATRGSESFHRKDDPNVDEGEGEGEDRKNYADGIGDSREVDFGQQVEEWSRVVFAMDEKGKEPVQVPLDQKQGELREGISRSSDSSFP